MKLSHYYPEDRSVQEHLRYTVHDGDGIIRTKPNGFLVGYDIRSCDHLGTSWEELSYHADAFASIFATLDADWCIHYSVFHQPGGQYPTHGAWPHPTIFLLDTTRKNHYQAHGNHFLSHARLWLSWQPNSAKQRLTDWLFGVRAAITTDEQQRATFQRVRNMLEGSLRPLCKQFTPIDFDAVTLNHHQLLVDRLLQRLGEEMYGAFGLIVADDEAPISISHILAESAQLQPDFKIGNRYIGVVGLRSYPRMVYPSILESLRYLPTSYRYSVRIRPYSMQQAHKKLHRIAAQHRIATLGIGLLTNSGGGQEEETPLAWNTQARDARTASQAGEAYCSLLPQIIVYGTTPQERDAAIEMVRVAIERAGFRPKTEDAINVFHAYLASLPGEGDANTLRTVCAPLRTAMRICTLTSTWHGPEHHPDPRYRNNDDDAPLMMMSTPAREPFRLNFHVGEVGHVMLIGRTGRGKSMLLRALENGHLSRYHRARVISFDFGLSAYKYARAIQGHHYTIAHGVGPQLAPLTGLEDITQFDAILDWIMTLLSLWHDKPLSVMQQSDLRAALESVRRQSDSGRRLSDCGQYVQDADVRSIFQQMTDSLLDAHTDRFSFLGAKVPYWCFELGQLGIENTRWTTPAILYLQRRAFAELEAGDATPTMITLDEGARALKIPSIRNFAERLEREGRKHRVQFLFATQGVGEILASPIRDVLIESTPTKIALANREAQQDVIRQGYLTIGFTPDDIATIASMDEYDLLVRNEFGVQVVCLRPTELEIQLFGNASKDDCNRIDALREQYEDAWLPQYLRACKNPDYAKMFEDLPLRLGSYA